MSSAFDLLRCVEHEIPPDEGTDKSLDLRLLRAWQRSGLPLCRLIAMAHAYHEGTSGLSSADVGDVELVRIVERYLAARK